MLKQQLQADAKEALKSGDSFSLGVLRMALSAVNLKEKDKKFKLSKEQPDAKEVELSDDEVLDVISSEMKKRKDAIALYQQGNRQELVQQEEKELAVLKKYLPEQLSEDQLRKMIEEAIATTGATSIKEMGKVMADLSPKIKGKADNAQVSAMVKELLS